ncbi:MULTISPECIES: beta-carotene hydroxylase [unclassified Roseofilum]|uniref:beta-carotene hydroxylase n=1 Tax=unclassified Roseofilum TaxID=2620099 RepID=UPI000E9733E0|nr:MULTISPECIES: fatty acid desaturase [unclassified Roseofilum]HBQ99373.1 beta-carotene hydroxylase [Cyanobacteria bacterium UBA11691]
MMVSEAQRPLTVPKELLHPPESFFNLNVIMFLAALILIGLSVWGYWWAGLPHWLSFIESILALHLAGTIIHDASHKAAHRDRILNAILGHGSALMLGFAFPVFTRVHIEHHINVNDPENDPDHFVSTGGPLWLINARFFYHEVYFFQRKLWKNNELLEWFLSRLFMVAIVAAAYHWGFLNYILNFWFVPSGIVGLALGLFFDYLPHRPFHETARWKNARVYPSPILNLLIFGQNYHLVHHLWPSIPWYYYEKTYQVMKPLLDRKGCTQTLGLLEKQSFWSFLYDVFIGIRFGGHGKSKD